MKVVVFTGAGISRESGIATFRDSEGLWANYRIENVCTPEALVLNREGVIDFYNMRRREVLSKEPNAAHRALVEHLGSGILRILEAYGRECFIFSDNFLRMVFPVAEPLSDQIVESPLLPRQELSARVIDKLAAAPLSRQEISTALGEKRISEQLNKVITQLLADGLIEYTLPDKPNSRLQKYRLAALGEQMKSPST